MSIKYKAFTVLLNFVKQQLTTCSDEKDPQTVDVIIYNANSICNTEGIIYMFRYFQMMYKSMNSNIKIS